VRTGLRVNHTGVGQIWEGLQDPQYLQQLLKTVQPEGVFERLFVKVVEKVCVALSSSDKEEYHHGQIHLKVNYGLG